MTSKRKRRLALFAADPHCYWCGRCLTLDMWPGDVQPPNFATLDHLRSRFHPLRTQPNPHGIPRTVMACHGCNEHRGAVEMRMVQAGKKISPEKQKGQAVRLTRDRAETCEECGMLGTVPAADRRAKMVKRAGCR